MLITHRGQFIVWGRWRVAYRVEHFALGSSVRNYLKRQVAGEPHSACPRVYGPVNRLVWHLDDHPQWALLEPQRRQKFESALA
ncbi:MAG: hypothetical protein VBE63_30645, partial [Lamprobacter sp.]|uniref:hypothetical protein n=1 Tax=Lamprobacter sp. TaxID=3100796 RepID=UPI002B25F5F6